MGSFEKHSVNGESITFSDVSLKIKTLFEGKMSILNKLNGSFPSGSFVGILGPSGAGKSSLLNVLSGWDRSGNVTGSILINGIPQNHLDKTSSYVTQDCHLHDLLTVEENLKFAADFKLGESASNLSKLHLIDDILHKFGLEQTRCTKAKHLSGGQRRRLSICLELIDKPDIIFCDEPTSGLDVVSSLQCVKYLKNLTLEGKTIVCTIHQPPDQIYNMFDIIYVIAEGNCVYQGGPNEIISFLEQAGMPCDIFHSPIEYVIDICSGDYGIEKQKLLTHKSHLTEMQVKSIHYPAKSTENVCECSTNCFKFKTLLRREFTKTKRDMFSTYLRFICMHLVVILASLLFWDIGKDGFFLIFTYNLMLIIHTSTMFTSIAFPVLACTYASLLPDETLTWPFCLIAVPTTMALTKREIFNNYYTTLHYYLVIILMDFIQTIVPTISSSFFLYYFVGMSLEMHRIILYLLSNVLQSSVGSAIGFFFGTLFPTKLAIISAIVVSVPISLLGGCGILIVDLPKCFNYISLALYSRHAAILTLVAMLGMNHSVIPCQEERSFCMFTDPEQFLLFVGVNPHEYMTSIYVLITWLIVVRICSYVSINYRLSYK